MKQLAPIAILTAAFATMAHAQQPASTIKTSAGNLRIERLAALEFPWGLAWLPDNRLLITEKPGRLRVWSNGRLSEPISGVPKVSYSGKKSEQGGLMDVAVDPEFARNQFVYLSYSEAAEMQPDDVRDTGDARFGGYVDLSDTTIDGGAVVRARLDGNQLRDVAVIWRQVPKAVGRGHFGHRLLFGPDGKLYITSGERMRFDPAQSMESNLGKVVRINKDGSIPSDNPFAGKTDARGDIWSLGHRNILAAVFDGKGKLWAFEMGPLHGDEINIIVKGQNYGWPAVSNGDNYGSSMIPDHPSAKEKYVEPVRTWTPVISPSGAMVYNGSMFTEWKGSVFVGGLSSKALVRMEVEDEKVGTEERIDMKSRIRDIIEAPDGAILAIIDDKAGSLIRISR